MLQLEPALVLAGGGDEVADRREDHRRRLAPGQEVEEDGDRGGDQPDQRPGMEKADHAARGDEASDSRRTTPYGVSVVTRW